MKRTVIQQDISTLIEIVPDVPARLGLEKAICIPRIQLADYSNKSLIQLQTKEWVGNSLAYSRW